MKQLIILVLSVLTALSPAVAATSDNSLWTLHLAYHDAECIVGTDATLYAVFNGNLLMYDTQEPSTTTFDKLTGLSSKGISDIGWSDDEKCLVILYDDNNIDFLDKDGNIFNLPQLKNFSDATITSNKLNVCGHWATISTTDGVVLIDVGKKEVRGYYQIGEARDAVVIGEKIFACLTARSVVQGTLTDNLYDPTQWKTALTLDVNEIAGYGNGAYLVSPYNTGNPTEQSGILFMLPGESGEPSITRVSSTWSDHVSVANGKPLFTGCGLVFSVSNEDYLTEDVKLNLGESLKGATYTTDGTYWILTVSDSLFSYKPDPSTDMLKKTDVTIGGFGPRRDYAFDMHYQGSRLLVAGGYQDYSAGKHFPPTAMAYENGKWTFFQEEGFQLNSNATYSHVYSIAQDPADASHHFVASRTGLLEYRDFLFQEHFNASNSPLENAYGASKDPNYCIVDGLSYDNQGNLFMTNYEADNSLLCLTADGKWAEFAFPSFTGISTPQKTLIDNDGRLWATSRRETSACNAGLFCLQYNGTPLDTSDDQYQFRSSAANEDGTTCEFGDTYDICLDNNGQIWFGTANGVFAVQDPATFLTTSFTVYQPKVPRNDGTNYADYLLTGTPVSAIAVDGGNRKWLGTFGSGIYLVSSDGTEVIDQFTTQNSPILSDNIWTLAVSPDDGTLMIGTDIGICSYRTGITPANAALQKGSIKISPNPVRPEYQGKVNITGLTENAEVKIVSTGSQLVARITATGGTAQWDISSQTTGQRVAPGIYYLLVTTSEGKYSIAAKIAVI